MAELTLVDVLDLGLSGVLLFLLLRREQRFDGLIDRILRYLEEGRVQRHKLANEVQTLKTGQDIIKQGMNGE